MKNRTRCIAAVLTAALLLFMAGCGGAPAASTTAPAAAATTAAATTTTAAATTEAATTAAATTAAATTAAAVTTAAAATTTAAGTAADPSLVEEIPPLEPIPDRELLEVSMMLPLYNEIPDLNDDYWGTWQKVYNLKLSIEFVPYADHGSNLNLRIASGDLPDIIQPGGYNGLQMREAVRGGYFWDLTDILGDFSNYPNLKESHELGMFDLQARLDGRYYGVPHLTSSINAATTVRSDLYEKLGLPLPTTTDEFADTLKQIIDSPITNPDGDMIGLVGNGVGAGSWSIMPDIDGTFMAAFGCLNLTYDDDGGLIQPQLTPQYADVVEYFRGLYETGCLPLEYPTFKTTQAEELYKLGKVVAYGRGVRQAGIMRADLQKSDPTADTIVLGPLYGPNGDAGIALQTGISGVFTINKNVPEAKLMRILQYLEDCATAEATEFAKFGLADIHHTVDANGQKILTEQGTKEINTTSTLVGTMIYDRYIKIWNPLTPYEYNLKNYEQVKDFDVIGVKNPFDVMASETWTTTQPDFATEYSTYITEAVMGVITMDDFRAYQEELRNLPNVKQAFQEFKVAYDEKFG